MEDFRFTTGVQFPADPFKITYDSRMVLLGSCFSDEIGRLLEDYRFNVLVNPFGTLYNPCSIRKSIERLKERRCFTAEEVIRTNPTDPVHPARYASFSHHSSYAADSREAFLEQANQSLAEHAGFLQAADTVIVTLGTAWVYRLVSDGSVVSNCHKHLATEFERSLLSVGECCNEIRKILELLSEKHVIFTISPIRHLKDGAHGNQISKATLLLALEKALQTAEDASCSYFPSYEIMMDELRDYRFYAEDMVHPSPFAVRYIFGKFAENCISPEENEKMARNLKISKREKHIQK